MPMVYGYAHPNPIFPESGHAFVIPCAVAMTKIFKANIISADLLPLVVVCEHAGDLT